jgi:hypothetical protein
MNSAVKQVDAITVTASLLKIFSGWLSDRLWMHMWLAVAGYAMST